MFKIFVSLCILYFVWIANFNAMFMCFIFYAGCTRKLMHNLHFPAESRHQLPKQLSKIPLTIRKLPQTPYKAYA